MVKYTYKFVDINNTYGGHNMNTTALFLFVLALMLICVILGAILAFVLTGYNPIKDMRKARKLKKLGH